MLYFMLNTKLQGGENLRLNDVLYAPQVFKNIPRILGIIEKGYTMGATKYKMNINRNGVSMTLNTRKGKTRTRCST